MVRIKVLRATVGSLAILGVLYCSVNRVWMETVVVSLFDPCKRPLVFVRSGVSRTELEGTFDFHHACLSSEPDHISVRGCTPKNGGYWASRVEFIHLADGEAGEPWEPGEPPIEVLTSVSSPYFQEDDPDCFAARHIYQD
jgi:hypothetical protein